MACVVVGHCGCTALLHRQTHWLYSCAWIFNFSFTDSTMTRSDWLRDEQTTSSIFPANRGSFGRLKDVTKRGSRPCPFQTA